MQGVLVYVRPSIDRQTNLVFISYSHVLNQGKRKQTYDLDPYLQMNQDSSNGGAPG